MSSRTDYEIMLSESRTFGVPHPPLTAQPTLLLGIGPRHNGLDTPKSRNWMFYSYTTRDGVTHDGQLILTKNNIDDALWVAKSAPASSWFSSKSKSRHVLTGGDLTTFFTGEMRYLGVADDNVIVSTSATLPEGVEGPNESQFRCRLSILHTKAHAFGLRNAPDTTVSAQTIDDLASATSEALTRANFNAGDIQRRGGHVRQGRMVLVHPRGGD